MQRPTAHHTLVYCMRPQTQASVHVRDNAKGSRYPIHVRGRLHDVRACLVGNAYLCGLIDIALRRGGSENFLKSSASLQQRRGPCINRAMARMNCGKTSGSAAARGCSSPGGSRVKGFRCGTDVGDGSCTASGGFGRGRGSCAVPCG